MWVPGINFRFSGLAAGAFTGWAIKQVPKKLLLKKELLVGHGGTYFNPNTRDAEAGGYLSLRMAWSIEQFQDSWSYTISLSPKENKIIQTRYKYTSPLVSITAEQ